MRISNARDFARALRDGPYTPVGSYPIFFITHDGAAFSFATAWKERSNIVEALNSKDKSGGWYVVAADVNWEDADLIDDHSGNRIESAYAEDDAEGDYDKIPEGYNAWRRKIRGR